MRLYKSDFYPSYEVESEGKAQALVNAFGFGRWYLETETGVLQMFAER